MKSSPPDSTTGRAARPETLADWLALIEYRHHTAVDLGLERCLQVWRRMGSPRPAGRVFVVAGTNGKGSTVATICALLGALGYRHGCYTTPHIHEYNERIQVNGSPVDDASLVEAFARVEAVRGDTGLSYFEFGTLAAIDILAREALDFAVMEIGLGGRLDAVNLLDADCSVITPIGLDHQEYLGSDLESIGREKAGIVRPGVPLVCGEPDPPASVLETARAAGAPVSRLGREFTVSPEAERCLFRMGAVRLQLPRPVLRGAHQLQNMATGLAAVLQLLPGAASRPRLLARGLKSVDLKGRFDRVHERPAVWIDVGHNPLGARVIAAALKKRGAGTSMNLRCVLAMLADKDAESVAAILSGVVDAWYCAGLGGDRGQDGKTLAARVAVVPGIGSVHACERVADALRAALANSAEEDGVLVFGSFHTADEADRLMIEFQRRPGIQGKT